MCKAKRKKGKFSRFVFFMAVILSLSAIGFSLNHDKKSRQPGILDKIETNLNTLENMTTVSRTRNATVRRVMNIIDKYNKNMPSSTKYAIASEIYEMALKFDNLNVDLICATITHESASSWNPKIVSNKGAMGLMQIMPGTAKYLAAEEKLHWTKANKILFDPFINIQLGCRYLSTLVDYYGIEGGLAAYNGGEKRAVMWLANNKAPGILWQETQHYVPAILKLYNKYKN